MPNTMIIQGKVETIFDDEDFARLIGERLGYDAEQYFREHWDMDYLLRDMTDDQMLEYCSGECSNVEEAIEHWTGVLQSVQDELVELQTKVRFQTKDETSIALLMLIQKINAEL
jgi:hypothetical protein